MISTTGWERALGIVIHLLQSQTFLNAFGAVIGGFLGVVLFFLIRLGIARILSWPKHIQTYDCAHEQNIGDTQEYPGQLLHHHGHRITDPQLLKTLSCKKPIWEYTSTACGKIPHGTSVIYGPYTTDFSEPGEYEVVFRVRGYGLTTPSELTHDPILIELDVTRTSPEIVPIGEGIASVPSMVTVSRRYVRHANLLVLNG